MGQTLLVTGGREWTQVKYLWAELDWIHQQNPIELLVEGCAAGADNAAEAWAASRGVPNDHYPALWKDHGGQLEFHPPEWADIIETCRCKPGADHCSFAGYRRNEEMVLESRPDRVAAFHDNISRSRGTRHTALLASLLGIPVSVHPLSLDTHLSCTIAMSRPIVPIMPCTAPGCTKPKSYRFALYRRADQDWTPTDRTWCEEHVPVMMAG